MYVPKWWPPSGSFSASGNVSVGEEKKVTGRTSHCYWRPAHKIWTARQVMALSVDILSNPIHLARHLLTTNRRRRSPSLLPKKVNCGKNNNTTSQLIRIRQFSIRHRLFGFGQTQLFIATLSKIIIKKKRYWKRGKLKTIKRKPPKKNSPLLYPIYFHSSSCSQRQSSHDVYNGAQTPCINYKCIPYLRWGRVGVPYRRCS